MAGARKKGCGKRKRWSHRGRVGRRGDSGSGWSACSRLNGGCAAVNKIHQLVSPVNERASRSSFVTERSPGKIDAAFQRYRAKWIHGCDVNPTLIYITGYNFAHLIGIRMQILFFINRFCRNAREFSGSSNGHSPVLNLSKTAGSGSVGEQSGSEAGASHRSQDDEEEDDNLSEDLEDDNEKDEGMFLRGASTASDRKASCRSFTSLIKRSARKKFVSGNQLKPSDKMRFFRF